MASKREFNPWGFLPLDLFQLQNITRKLWLPALLELRPLISLLQPILLGSLPPPPHSYPSSSLSFWAPYPPSPTHIPPAAYPSGLPTPLLTHIPPAAYPSVLPTPPTHIPPAAYPSGLPTPLLTHIPPAAYPSVLPTPPPLISLLLPILRCSLSPPNHIPPAAYPSELPNPCPLPPMNALEESITEILQRP